MFNNFKSDQCYIIAEIGGNFTSFEQAKQLIDAAADCQVDAIKLQTYQADTIVTKSAKFDLDNISDISQYEFFLQYQIDKQLHEQTFDYIHSKGLDWFSTPSHPNDINLLEQFNVGAHKIGADDATNLPLLHCAAKTGKPILLSTGMCTIQEVHDAVDCILQCGNEQIYIFHTISNYPTYPEQVNLLAMQTLMKEFPGMQIGFSDHTIGTTAAICAAAMGAKLVEKHFTYDKSAEGPDHMLSANPEEMKAIVNTIREFEIMKGSAVKRPVGKEVISREKNRKSITSIKAIKKGEILSAENIDIKRPGHGISPKFIESLYGKTVSRDIASDETIVWSDIN